MPVLDLGYFFISFTTEGNTFLPAITVYADMINF